MSSAFFWLTLTIVATALMWFPYVLNSFARRGMFTTMGYDSDVPELAEWAQRAKKAHLNAVENLVLFAPLLIIHQLSTAGKDAAMAGTIAMVYFAGRMAHYVVYTAKVPIARTLFFFVGYGATLFLAVRVLGVM